MNRSTKEHSDFYEEPLYAVVADIGGTNARFSRVNLNTLTMDKVKVYPCLNFSSLVSALMFYQQEQCLLELKQVVIAIACPVIDDYVSMTNFHWQFSIKEVQSQLNLENFYVINDFTAIAMSLPFLAQKEMVQVGGGQSDLCKPRVILGAGTGLGVAHLISTTEGFIPLAGEGGHMTWAPQNEQEVFIQRYLTAHYDHVSWERLLSGPGLENLYLALAAYQKKQVRSLTAKEITAKALKGGSLLAKETIGQFLASLGAFAGDLALAVGAWGGVYIAGGIIPKFLDLIDSSEFRRRFESKGRSSHVTCQISTHIVLAKQPGLLGAAVYLKQKLEQKEKNFEFSKKTLNNDLNRDLYDIKV